MPHMTPKVWQGMVILGMLLGLPLVGVLAVGIPIQPYLQFPPQTSLVDHAPFSWAVFALLLMATCAMVVPLLVWCLLTWQKPGVALQRLHPGFPWWAWTGLGLTLVAWFLAWTRLPWFAWGQWYTFPFLWVGYILVVNGLTWKRSGQCMLTRRPGHLLLLFPVSAVFWWFFEYLNRFVQNWHYLRVDQFSGPEYVLHATVCFATVLPAVVSTKELVSTFPVFDQCFARMGPLQPSRPRAVALGLLILFSFGLALIGVWPDQLFPLLWVAPLVIIVSLQTLFKEKHVFSPLASGNWSPVITAALAALICGFFWEMWNMYSLAKWVYSVPYVQRFHVFEMPILGYAGYLPFGLECVAIDQWLFGGREKNG